MAEYGDEIIRLIVEMELSPREVCTALTLCHPHAPPHADAVDDASGKCCATDWTVGNTGSRNKGS